MTRQHLFIFIVLSGGARRLLFSVLFFFFPNVAHPQCKAKRAGRESMAPVLFGRHHKPECKYIKVQKKFKEAVNFSPVLPINQSSCSDANQH
jgi:hypothetical protein